MPNVAQQDINLLHALEIFVVVAEQGGMTPAGSVLGMTQSAVSQQIHSLEETIGTLLFDRDLRPLRLTVAGTVMLERAKQLLFEAKGLRAAMRHSLGIAIPHLRIGVLQSVAGTLVAPLVFDLIDRACARSVSVRTGFGNEQQRALQNRELDLILVADPVYEVTGLERHELFSEPFVLLVPPSLGGGEQPALPALAKSLPLIRHANRSPIGMEIERHLRRLRVAAPPYVEFDSIDSIVAAVSLGRGWAISTPTLLLQGLRAPHHVGVRPLPPPALLRSFALLARDGELGSLPAEVARLARSIMRESVMPRVRALAPFLERAFEIPAADPAPG